MTDLDRAIAVIIDALRSGGTLYACGNGGSHAHADHLVAELVGRYAYDRPPLRAVLLSTGGAVGSCIANDYGWERVFSRQVEALCGVRQDSNDDEVRDVLVCFTTSGRSQNIRWALDAANEAGASMVALCGPNGVGWETDRGLGRAVVRSTATTTPAIQEQHQAQVHEIASRVEMEMFPR